MKNGVFNIEIKEEMILWTDKKRILGLPISFTRYSLNSKKILINSGFLNLEENEILLYRIRDTKLNQSFFDRIFKVGTITVYSTDASMPTLELKNVKFPKKVKEVLSAVVEQNRKDNGIKATELMTGIDTETDLDNNGVLDALETNELFSDAE